MPGTLQVMGNGLAAVWLALAVLGVATAAPSQAHRGHDGTGLVMWGSYLVALLALNVHTSPFGTLPAIAQYAGVGLAAAAAVARVVTAAAIGLGAGERAWCAIPVCHALFCIGLTCASGNIIALATVVVAATAATVIALSHVRSGD